MALLYFVCLDRSVDKGTPGLDSFVEGDRYSVASEGGTTVFCSADFDGR